MKKLPSKLKEPAEIVFLLSLFNDGKFIPQKNTYASPKKILM